MNPQPTQARGLLRPLLGWLLVGMLSALMTSGATATAADPPSVSEGPDSADELANQAAHDVFAGEAYWWKRTSDLQSGWQSTSMIGRFFSWVYQTLIEPILNGIKKIVVWILDWIFGSSGMGKGDWSKGVPFLWTIVAALVLFAAWRVAKALRRPPVVRAALDGRTAVDVLPQADQLLEQSRLALAQGDHRFALRFALLSLLAWLQDRGQLKYDSSRSNREYQQDLRRWPESATVFGAVAAPFERCWYGGRNPDDLQVREVIALCRNHFQAAKDST